MSKILIDEATVKLALDAFSVIEISDNLDWIRHQAEQQAAALREALAEPDFWAGYVPEPDKRQQALDKKAENAKELGLDYEPAQQERPSFAEWTSDHVRNNLHKLKPQPVQQDIPDLIAGALGVSRGTAYDMMREALASEAKEQPAPVAKPHEQEPVAIHQFRSPHCSDWYDGVPDHHDGHGPYEVRTLYASPPAQRKPLTDDEIWREYRFLWPFHPAEERKLASDILMFARAIEAAHGIKEKNT